jgi:hypothetical protein
VRHHGGLVGHNGGTGHKQGGTGGCGEILRLVLTKGG